MMMIIIIIIIVIMIIIIIIIVRHLSCANSITCSNAHDKIKNEIKRLKS